MKANKEPWSLVIGQVTAPFGTQGEVRVRLETDFPERFEELDEVCLELPDGREQLVHVRRARITPKGVIMAIAESRSRSEADSLRGAWVKVKPSMAVPLPKGSYWISDIVGLRVVTVQGEDLGEVTEVLRTPAHDVYVTPSTMVPAVREMVLEVDPAGGKIIVSLPPEYGTDTEKISRED
jgi:16S rRNA processing protein RimM